MITRARGTEKPCESCGGSFEPGEHVSYAGRGRFYHRGDCSEAAASTVFPFRPSRRGGTGVTYGALAA